MLSKDEVKHIALLARIGIKEEEIEKYQKNLSSVIDFFQELETAVTDDVLLPGHITGMSDVARADQEEDFGEFGREAILSNVPAKKDGFVKVKSVF